MEKYLASLPEGGVKEELIGRLLKQGIKISGESMTPICRFLERIPMTTQWVKISYAKDTYSQLLAEQALATSQLLRDSMRASSSGNEVLDADQRRAEIAIKFNTKKVDHMSKCQVDPWLRYDGVPAMRRIYYSQMDGQAAQPSHEGSSKTPQQLRYSSYWCKQCRNAQKLDNIKGKLQLDTNRLKNVYTMATQKGEVVLGLVTGDILCVRPEYVTLVHAMQVPSRHVVRLLEVEAGNGSTTDAICPWCEKSTTLVILGGGKSQWTRIKHEQKSRGMAAYSELERAPFGMMALTVESFGRPLSRFSDCSVSAQEDDLEGWMEHYEVTISQDAGVKQLELVTNGTIETSGRGSTGNFRHYYRPDAGPVPSRVIDVQTRQVRAYAGEKYAIVSYVWRQWDVESVVELACEMARRHGIPGVWIDAKCIYQGDDETSRADKERQIPLMGDYYAGATVTYVLVPEIFFEPYVCPLDRDTVYCIADTVGWEKIIAGVLGSVWMSRIWTAQEAYRSKNAVFLMEGGIIHAPSLAMVAAMRMGGRKFGVSNWCPEGDSVLISGSSIQENGVKDATGFATLHRFRSDRDLKDFTEMWDQHSNRQATIDMDRIYGLLGMTSVGKLVSVNYKTTIKEKIRELAANGLLSMTSLLTDQVSQSDRMSWWGSRILGSQAEFNALSHERLSLADNGMPVVIANVICIRDNNMRQGGVTLRKGSSFYIGMVMEEDLGVETGDYLAVGIAPGRTCLIPGREAGLGIWQRTGRARVLLNTQGNIGKLEEMKTWHIG